MPGRAPISYRPSGCSATGGSPPSLRLPYLAAFDPLFLMILTPKDSIGTSVAASRTTNVVIVACFMMKVRSFVPGS